MRPSDAATVVVDKKRLKKTGVIIPRTTPLEMYRSGMADTVTKTDLVEQAVAAIVEPPTEDTTVKDVTMDVANGNTGSSSNMNTNDDNRVLDTMLGHESESFLSLDESTEETNPHDHPEMTQV